MLMKPRITLNVAQAVDNEGAFFSEASLLAARIGNGDYSRMQTPRNHGMQQILIRQVVTRVQHLRKMVIASSFCSSSSSGVEVLPKRKAMKANHGVAPRNGTFTGNGFLLAHGLRWRECDYTLARAADFLAHNTLCACACTAITETTRLCLTMHPRVSYHLSLLQVHCHMIAILAKAMTTPKNKQNYVGPDTSMRRISVRLCAQMGTIWHLCGFHKGGKGGH